jgi:hypothetical protein
MFRIQRELYVQEVRKEPTWITWADRLVISSTLTALLFLVLPIVALVHYDVAATVTSVAVILLSGYVPSILAHYRFFVPGGPPRSNPEPLERKFVWTTLVVGMIGAVATFWLNIRAGC